MTLALCKQLQEKLGKEFKGETTFGTGKGFLMALMFCLKFESKTGCQNCPQVVGVPLLKWKCFAVENIAGPGVGGSK